MQMKKKEKRRPLGFSLINYISMTAHLSFLNIRGVKPGAANQMGVHHLLPELIQLGFNMCEEKNIHP